MNNPVIGNRRPSHGMVRRRSSIMELTGTTPVIRSKPSYMVRLVLAASLIVCACSFSCQRDDNVAIEGMDTSSFVDLLRGDGFVPLVVYGVHINLSVSTTPSAHTMYNKVPVSTDIDGHPSTYVNLPDNFEGVVAGVTGSQVWLSVTEDPSIIVGSITFPSIGSDPEVVLDVEANDLEESAIHVKCRYLGSATQFEDSETRTIRFREEDGRSRRASPRVSDSNTGCSVYVDVDQAFFEYWGEKGVPNGDTAAKMRFVSAAVVSLINDVDVIYGAQTSLRLFASGILLHVNEDNVGDSDATSGADFLGGYERWLVPGATRTDAAAAKPRGLDQPRASDSCMNLLLTHRSLGGTVGTANVASARSNVVGGACETYLWKANGQFHALNTMMATSRGSSRDLSLTEVLQTIAHEIGHSFGASHTCSGSNCGNVFDQCNPTLEEGGRYLMYPQLSTGQPNNQRFSSCTLSKIDTVMGAKGGCLVEMETDSYTSNEGVCEIIHGVDFFGGDLTSFSLNDIPDAERISTCADACFDNHLCVAFTLAWSRCYLKHSGHGQRSLNNALGGSCIRTLTESLASTSAPTLVTTTATSEHHSSSSCSITAGVDYNGGDIQGGHYYFPSGVSGNEAIQMCSESCIRHQECQFFTAVWNRCWMKRILHESRTQSRATSGDCRGAIESSTQTSAPSAHPSYAPSASPISSAPSTFPTSSMPSRMPSSSQPSQMPSPGPSVANLEDEIADGITEDFEIVYAQDSGMRFDSVFTGAATVFTIAGEDAQISTCQNACLSESSCIALSWWVSSGGDPKCRGLSSIGSAGSTTSVISMISLIRIYPTTTSSPTPISQSGATLAPSAAPDIIVRQPCSRHRHCPTDYFCTNDRLCYSCSVATPATSFNGKVPKRCN